MRPAILNAISFLGILSFVTNSLSAEEPVEFDAPAMVAMRSVDQGQTSHLQPVRLEVPVSLLLRAENLQLEEFLVAVYWSSEAHQVDSFAPNTSLGSDIEGVINIQKSTSNNASFGLDAQGGYAEFVGLKGKLNLGTTTGESRSYQQRPKMQLLATSGTIKRGTGVFYKFKNSDQTTLEGTQVLTITFLVPQSWRAGLLRVDCQAKGKRKGFTAFDSKPTTVMDEFVTAVYRAGDSEAYELAVEYVRQKTRLKKLGQSDAKSTRNEKWGLVKQLIRLNDSQNSQLALEIVPASWRTAAVQFVDTRSSFLSLQ